MTVAEDAGHTFESRYPRLHHHPPSTPLQHDSLMRSPTENSVIQSQEPPWPSEEGKTPEPDGADRQQKAAEGLTGREKAKINPQKVENSAPKNRKEKEPTGYRAAVKQIEEALEKQDQQIQAMSDELAGTKDELAQTKDELARIKGELARTKDELARTKVEIEKTKDDLAFYSRELPRTKDELARTKVELAKANELSTARLTELARAQSFLSTDHISEAEVLGIVRDLNENIIQLAANLTDEWGKLKSPQPNSRTIITKQELDAFMQLHGRSLVRRVRNRDPPAVAFLVQSCLCYAVTQITLGWRRDLSDERPWRLGSVYKRLSTYGKHTSYAAIEGILMYQYQRDRQSRLGGGPWPKVTSPNRRPTASRSPLTSRTSYRSQGRSGPLRNHLISSS